MLWLEQKYISLLSMYLDGFKKVDKNTYNFKCNICGDSASKRKMRGYLYLKRGKYSFFCHNCSASRSLDVFMKEVNPTLYSQYVFEKIQENKPVKVDPDIQYKMDIPQFKENPIQSLYKIEDLPNKHPAKEYLVSRNISRDWFGKLYYVDQFKQWINGIVPGKFENTKTDSGRVIIPIIINGEIVGVNGRSLNPTDTLRYICIMFNTEAPRIFNYDNIDVTKRIYVFEGSFDSMFIPNSLAVCGGQLIAGIEHFTIPKDNFCIVYDNEPRNKTIADNVRKAALLGYHVCIWQYDNSFKDVNDLINNGMSPEDIKVKIDRRTFTGTRALLEWNTWKK